jgi:hypothetical protein
MSSTNVPLTTHPKPAQVASELQIPANTMENSIVVYVELKKEKDETFCSLKKCVYISACSCGISSIVFMILHL